MPKTETNISNLKINRGTYEAIQANLSSIGENELIITTDKVLPIPTSSDSGKVVSVDSNGEYVLTTSSGGSTPITAQGDLIVGDSNGSPARLAVGSNHQILTSYSGSPYWRDLVADYTDTTYVTLTSTDWTNLKSNHYFTKSVHTPVTQDFNFPVEEESRCKISINSINYEVRLSLNSSTEAKGLFIVKESSSIYEIAMFVSFDTVNSVVYFYFRCAQIA